VNCDTALRFLEAYFIPSLCREKFRAEFTIKHRGLTLELTHAGPMDADREAELKAPSGIV
jgi:hypothetical protein